MTARDHDYADAWRSPIEVGTSSKAALDVTPDMLVPAFSAWFPDWGPMPSVLATIVVAGFAEQVSVALIHPRLREGYVSLGAELSVAHIAPAFRGDTIICEAALSKRDGRRLSLLAQCRSARGEIARIAHTRIIASHDAYTSEEAGYG